MMLGGLLAIGAGTAAAANSIVVGPNDSIQAAINAVPPGGTVIVQGGVHAEHLVITKTVNLVGSGNPTLVSPQGEAPPSPCSGPDPNEDGVCVAGNFTFDNQGNITIYSSVQGVRISGFTIRGFDGTGIEQFAGSGSTFTSNRLLGNGEYGIAAFFSTGTTEVSNFATGSGEAGFYIGDSHPANATLTGNTSTDNLFGFFIRDAEYGRLASNDSHGNCIGILFVADAPGPDGAFNVQGNSVNQNNKACPADPDEQTPPLSGLGLVLFGAHDVNATGNIIKGNVASGDSLASAGVALLPGDLGTPPTNNTVRGNVIQQNSLDILWFDQIGTGNVLQPNVCQTSDPSGLCSS